MAGFATADDVATAMKRTFTNDEKSWVETLLDQSAGYLRDVIGQQVYPSVTATYVAYPVNGRVILPQSYVQEVVSVKDADGNDVPYERFEDTLENIHGYKSVEVTFTYGANEAPKSLVGVNVAMVSSAVTLVENDLGVNLGGLSSIALDDFKVAFADGGDKTGHMTLPELTQQNLRAAYGAFIGTVDMR